jgi:hypothetical protein
MSSNNEVDDGPAINSYNERTPLLNSNTHPNNSIISTPNVDTILVPSISHYRPTNILRVIFFIEFLTLAIIWLTGRIFFVYSSLKTFVFNR